MHNMSIIESCTNFIISSAPRSDKIYKYNELYLADFSLIVKIPYKIQVDFSEINVLSRIEEINEKIDFYNKTVPEPVRLFSVFYVYFFGLKCFCHADFFRLFVLSKFDELSMYFFELSFNSKQYYDSVCCSRFEMLHKVLNDDFSFLPTSNLFYIPNLNEKQG